MLFSGRKLYEFPLKEKVKVRGRIKFDPVIGEHSPFDTNYKGEPIIRIELTKKEKEEFENLAFAIAKIQKVPPFTFRCGTCKSTTILTDIILDKTETKVQCLECRVDGHDELYGMKPKEYTPIKVLGKINSVLQ